MGCIEGGLVWIFRRRKSNIFLNSMCHLRKRRMETVIVGDSVWPRVRVEFTTNNSHRVVFNLNGHKLLIRDKESLQKRADAFYENTHKLMDAYSFQLQRTFGEKAKMMFAWSNWRHHEFSYDSLSI